jgi:hypothetical protein
VVLLDGIVGEVDELVVKVLHVELLRGSADVTVLVPVALLVAIDARDENIGTNVEFPLLVEEGHNVLLNYVSTGPAHLVDLVLLDDLPDLLNILDHFDACTSVGVLPRFDQPGIPLLRFETVLKLLVLFLLLLVLDILRPSFVLLLEFLELFVFAIGDVEGHGDVLEGIGLLGLVVVFEVHEESLFVGKVPVVGDVVVHLNVGRPVLNDLHLVP